MKNVIVAICFVLFSITTYGATKAPKATLPDPITCITQTEKSIWGDGEYINVTLTPTKLEKIGKVSGSMISDIIYSGTEINRLKDGSISFEDKGYIIITKSKFGDDGTVTTVTWGDAPNTTSIEQNTIDNKKIYTDNAGEWECK
jgi:hypothetical protein